MQENSTMKKKGILREFLFSYLVFLIFIQRKLSLAEKYIHKLTHVENTSVWVNSRSTFLREWAKPNERRRAILEFLLLST